MTLKTAFRGEILSLEVNHTGYNKKIADFMLISKKQT
jgi:hypothetical protein